MKRHISSQTRVRVRRPWRAILVGAYSLLLATLAAQVGAEPISGAPSDDGPAGSDGQPNVLLRPVKVVSTTGNVSNADALVSSDGGATLTMIAGAPAPMIILDYGRDVGGLPVFDVTAVSGTPKLQAMYSEAQQYLLPGGDAAAPGTVQDPNIAQAEVSFVGDAAGANLSRLDTYPLTRPGLIVEALVQGGERFEAITWHHQVALPYGRLAFRLSSSSHSTLRIVASAVATRNNRF
jgi:hypothetical protein